VADKKKKSKGQEVNRADLADINGVSLPTVDEWVRRGCPVVQRGGRGRAWKFNTAEVRSWRDDDIRAQAIHPEMATKEQLVLRKLAAETEQAELDLAKARGQVVPVDQFERAMTKAFGEVRAGLRNALPGRVARRLLGESDETKMKEVMLDEVDQILLVLSDSDLIHESDLEIDDEEDDDEGADSE
jgi:phage terminase Nu1 subunit (DNA packaging protein)